MMTIVCTEVYKSTFQDKPCTIVVGSLPKKSKPTIPTLGQLTSASDSPDTEVRFGHDLGCKLPVAPIRVLIEDTPKTICISSIHYDAIEMSWGALVFSIVLPLIEIEPETLVNRELQLFGLGETIKAR